MEYFTPFIVLLILFVLIAIIFPVGLIVFMKIKQLKLFMIPKEQWNHSKLVKENKNLTSELEVLENKFKILNNQKNELEKDIIEEKNKTEKLLLKVNNLTETQAKNELLEFMKNKYRKEVANDYIKIKNEFNESYQIYAQNILVETMEQISEPFIVERSLYNIKITDDNIKGKIIGRDGRNKAAFENEGGVDLIVDRQQPIIGIASPNPIRREIARIVMEKLIDSKNIDINRIELLFKEERDKFQVNLQEIGRSIIEDQLGFYDFPKDLYPYIGRMKYRNSYGQNILSHSLEVAEISERIAKLIGIDPIEAKKVSFFHDIGKTIDYESNMDHVEAGLIIAKKFNLSKNIYNGIESHHGKVIPTSIYAALVKVSDTLSAARPGARINSFEEYFERVTELENICYSFNGVKSAYVIKSGRQLRVIVDSSLYNDIELEELGHKIKTEIENHELLGNYKVKLVLIKETKVILETNTIN